MSEGHGKREPLSEILDIGEVEHLLGAIRISLQQGGAFLVNRRAPNGPIMRQRNLSYVYKVIWGMYAAGVDEGIIAELLDWAQDNALQPSGDFYFPEETSDYRVRQRVYRPLTFGKVAVRIDHPIAHNELIVNRIRQYQHESGGVFNYIGDDPQHLEEQPFIGTLNTSCFGHFVLALGMKREALAAGDWLCRFVEANRGSMHDQGVMYTRMGLGGELVTDIEPDQKIGSLVNNRDPKQEFWNVGTIMAYLAVLYDVMLSDWGEPPEKARPYLENALILLDFEDTMPLETYLWPSKCKVGWGAGELLRVLVKYGEGTADQVSKAYRVCKKVATFTFIDNQLPHGGWSCMHYALRDSSPALKFEYKPLKGIVNVPEGPIPGSNTIFLSAEEISGEFLGEMKSIEVALTEVLKLR